MKTILFFLLDEYADWEGAYLAPQLKETRHYEVKTVSLKREIITSIGGFKLLPDYAIDQLPNDYEGILFIGSKSWSLKEKRITSIVKEALSKGRVVGAICGAVDFFARNSLLNNHQHTGNSVQLWSEYTLYENQLNFVESQVIRDKNLITANGSAPLEFTREVLYALKAMDEVEIAQNYDFYRLGYYEFLK